MHDLTRWFNLSGVAWNLICATILVGLLGACTTINVSVDECQTRPVTTPPGAGGCNPPQAYSGSADGFWNTVTKLQIPSGSGLTCSGPNSQQCNTQMGPGKCGFTASTTCKNWYDPNTQICSCGCP